MIENMLIRGLESDVREFLSPIVHERGLADNTMLAYEQGLARFASFARSGGIQDYRTPQAIELASYLESLQNQGLAPATRCLSVIALLSFYRRQVIVGRIAAAAARPVFSLSLPKIPERLPRVLSVEEVRRLLDALPSVSRMYLLHKAILEFLYATGCRVSEAVNARLADVDFVNANCTIMGKGDKPRVGLLGEPALEALGAYVYLLRENSIRRCSVEPPWAFVSRSGRRLSRELVWMLIKGCAIVAGLPEWVSPHSLRHAAATHFLVGGADLLFVREFLGHARVETTAIYLHVDSSQLRKVHNKFEEYRQHCNGANTQDAKANELHTAPMTLPDIPIGDEMELMFRIRRLPSWSPEHDELVQTLPHELAEDGAVGMEAWLGTLIGQRIGRIQAKDWTSRVLIPAATQGAAAASHTVIAYTDVMALEYAVDPAYRQMPTCGWMVNNNIRQLLREINDGAGLPIFFPRRRPDELDYLDGFPVIYNPYLPSTLAAGNQCLFFSDLSRIHIRDIRETRIVRLAERFALHDQVALGGFLRSDCVLMDAGTHPIQYLLQ